MKEFDIYNRNVSSIENNIHTKTIFKLTTHVYEYQLNTKQRILKLLQKLQHYEHPLYIHTIQKRCRDLETLYHKSLVYMYLTERLIIDESLLKREDVREILGIRKKKVSFSTKSIIHIIEHNSEEIYNI